MTQTSFNRFANSGTEAVVGDFLHRPSRRRVPVVLSLTQEPTGEHLLDELGCVEIGHERVLFTARFGLPDPYAYRIKTVLHFLLPYLENAQLSGRFAVSLGDEGLNAKVLSFCSNTPDFLVPDADFVITRGYANYRKAFASAPAWDERADKLYWRGTDTGVWRYDNVEDAPRVAVCGVARKNPSLINAAISRIEPRGDPDRKRSYYVAREYFGAVEDQTEIIRYRYQIDIDGTTSAWSSLFLKLLSGSPVLKVASDFHWQQWYYPALQPWENYIPVRSDLKDLIDVLSWLRSNPAEARRIGENSRTLAQSLTLMTEIPKAMKTLGRLIALNARGIFPPGGRSSRLAKICTAGEMQS